MLFALQDFNLPSLCSPGAVGAQKCEGFFGWGLRRFFEGSHSVFSMDEPEWMGKLKITIRSISFIDGPKTSATRILAFPPVLLLYARAVLSCLPVKQGKL
jgi:hypothetical protein